MFVCYYVFKQLLCLFDGAKVRRFPHSHNPMCVAFEYHNYGISTKKASKMRNSTGDLANIATLAEAAPPFSGGAPFLKRA